MIKFLFFGIILIASYLFYYQYQEISRLKFKQLTLQENKNANNPEKQIVKSQLLNIENNTVASTDLKQAGPPTQLLEKKPVSPAIVTFMQDAYVSLNLPEAYSYSYFDNFSILNISLAVLHGIDDLNNISIIGTRYVTKNIPALLQELSENTHLFVNARTKDFLGLAKSNISYHFTKPGIKKISVLKYKTAQKIIYASYIVRADLKASYFILVSSPTITAKKTLLSIVNSIKAL